GLDVFSAGDHLAVPAERLPYATRYWFDPTTFLAHVAAHSRLRLLTNVLVVPYRSPLQTAKALATLDFLSDGRVIFGAGVGHMAAEFAALGVPFGERGRRTDEYLRAIKTLW